MLCKGKTAAFFDQKNEFYAKNSRITLARRNCVLYIIIFKVNAQVEKPGVLPAITRKQTDLQNCET